MDIEVIKALLNYMFGGQPPAWLLPTIAWSIGVGLFLRGMISLLGLIQKMWTEFLRPIYYKPEEVWRRSRRRKFAESIEAETRRLNSLEAWNDNRFAELEAEVEAEGRRKLFDFLKIGFSPVSNLYKERSLSRALEHSSERLILVEGDPGSGKSVALRHLAQSMARKASLSKSLKSIIPLYINLKHLRRSPKQAIKLQLIEEFVLETLKRANNRDVEAFLDDEFERGLQEGTWLFLFDSFDEIPDILSSTEADDVIREYAEAISSFLHGMNGCRGIVASREYKGPRFLGWPKFRILPLTLDRKRELIKRTGFRLDVQKAIVNGISQSAADFRTLTGNPMFLNLLCEFMNKKDTPEFPRHTHNIFNDYIWKRLEHDEERLQKRFSKTPAQIRDAAEKLAFCMTADTGIGLSPSLDQLKASTRKLHLSLGREFSTYVTAIEYLKLARLEPSIQNGSAYFTFAHRRFQEYFATAVVLREPERIDVRLLLTDARWRETAVVILQTQSPKTLAPLFADIRKLLKTSLHTLCKDKVDAPEKATAVLPSYGLGKLGKNLFESFQVSRTKIEGFFQIVESCIRSTEDEDRINLPLEWPKHLFHILGILQEGLSTKYELLPENIRRMVDELLLFLMRSGSLDDRKWALDVAGSASLGVLEKAIDTGLSSPGTWVKNSAILQVSKLAQIPGKFSKHIISNLLVSAQEELLLERRYEIYAQFARFTDHNYLNVASLIVWMPFVDFFLTFLSGMLIVNLMNSTQQILYPVMILFLVISGIIVRWRSSSILKAISDIYSARSSHSSSQTPVQKRLRVKLPKRSDINLVRKLMSLLVGSLFSIGGIVLFLFYILLAKLYIPHPYIWITLLIFASLQLWSLVGAWEAFRLARTSLGWRLMYFFYPLILSVVFPIALVLYLLDHLYLASRTGIAAQILMKSRIRQRFIPFMYSGNFYAELWMPAPLMMVLVVALAFNSLAATAEAWFLLAWIGIALLVFGYLLGSPMLVFAKEWQTYTTAQKGLTRMDVCAFVKIVEEITNNRHRSQLIYSVLDKGYLIPSPANLARLRVLIAYLQTTLASEYTVQNLQGLAEIDRELAVALGYVDENNYPPSNNWDEAQLDLLCRMLEQLRKVAST
ncbi:MAG TPA: NACHT domain-containing protein [Anaerolineales bacterium]|nr:NACHT domain-containing protein [Anaerolineales bacterium]